MLSRKIAVAVGEVVERDGAAYADLTWQDQRTS
jgi:hypothetical protein